MKIIVIGASGTIGQAITAELKPRHEIVTAGSKSGDVQVDITDKQSIETMYKAVKDVDAVVVATGKLHFGDFMEMSEAEYQIGLQNKLMGQVNLVLIGRNYLNDNGSFTLISGILNHDPIRYGSSAAMVDGAVDGFVKGAAIEMPRGIRINVVSPTVIEESLETYAPYFRGFQAVSRAQAALAYSKSVEGLQTGQVYRVGY